MYYKLYKEEEIYDKILRIIYLELFIILCVNNICLKIMGRSFIDR